MAAQAAFRTQKSMVGHIHLKEEIGDRLTKRAEEMGIPDLLDKIADETVGTTEEEILPFLEEKGHPALTMDPLLE